MYVNGPEREWNSPPVVWVVVEWNDHAAFRVLGVYTSESRAEAERRVEPIRRRVIESALHGLSLSAF